MIVRCYLLATNATHGYYRSCSWSLRLSVYMYRYVPTNCTIPGYGWYRLYAYSRVGTVQVGTVGHMHGHEDTPTCPHKQTSSKAMPTPDLPVMVALAPGPSERLEEPS